ncbi:hypothetical protein Tco_1370631 [Tanacetum coccineum]
MPPPSTTFTAATPPHHLVITSIATPSIADNHQHYLSTISSTLPPSPSSPRHHQHRKMGSNEEIRRLAQEAEKQQLFAQKVQQQNTNLTSQLEMYKERVRILEGINKDNNYLNEFLEADERAKRYNRQAQS